jgi:hypothetical protein
MVKSHNTYRIMTKATSNNPKLTSTGEQGIQFISTNRLKANSIHKQFAE